MEEEYGLNKVEKQEISKASINDLLDKVRPSWKGRGLIKRVERLLPVDPSSACQKLFNASIFDLREKIVTVGTDIARDIAKNYKLPLIEKDDDILENYSVTNVIDLSYRIGILSRPEWRRIQRCYEIRKDLEHEDNEYEAVLEDCFYIFKSTIETVLSQDPVEILKITDVKQIVSEPQRITVTEELLEDYEHAPELRQEEILDFLIASLKSEILPEIVRENAFEMIRHLRGRTKTPVTISIAQKIEKKLGRAPLDIFTATLLHALCATPYFKSSKIIDLYIFLSKKFKGAESSWREQTMIAKDFHDIGHFNYCPSNQIDGYLKFLVKWYIGTPGGYGYWGANREVFFSNGAAPIISRIIQHSEINLYDKIEALRDDNDINYHLDNRHILKRFEDLLDFSDKKN